MSGCFFRTHITDPKHPPRVPGRVVSSIPTVAAIAVPKQDKWRKVWAQQSFLDVLAIGWLSDCRFRAADWKRLTLRARCLFKLSEKVPDGGRTKGIRPG